MLSLRASDRRRTIPPAPNTGETEASCRAMTLLSSVSRTIASDEERYSGLRPVARIDCDRHLQDVPTPLPCRARGFVNLPAIYGTANAGSFTSAHSSLPAFKQQGARADRVSHGQHEPADRQRPPVCVDI